jgi:uncharacterized protein (TIGR02996 family)
MPQESLLQAVYDAPDDDAPRAVLGDFLQGEGDPRGDFIALQLQRVWRPLSAVETKRELALLRKHQKTWLGALAAVVCNTSEPVCGEGTPFEENFPRWHRGFLAHAMLAFTTPKLKALGTSPAWATLENVGGLINLRRAALPSLRAHLQASRGLRGINDVMPELLSVIESLPSLVTRLEHVHIHLVEDGIVSRLMAWPRLRQLELTVPFGDRIAGVSVLQAVLAPQWARLERIRLSGEPDLSIAKTAQQDLALTVGSANEATRRLLEVIPAARVTSLEMPDLKPAVRTEVRRRFPRARGSDKG